jgi:hypothetical protein
MSNTSSGRTNYDLDSSRGVLAFGITSFAGFLLITVSIFQILEGIAAIADDKVYVRGLSYTYEFDVTTWGWIHLVLGLVALGTGIGILMGQTWGRIMGIVIAGLSTVSNFMFMPYYPFWSIAVIALNVFVIWALCTQLADERV